MSKLPVYTWDEIRRHSSVEQGAWLVAGDFVYDVTQFLVEKKHPAGNDCIERRLGRDVTESFQFHSQYAQQHSWLRYRIGRVAGTDKDVALFEACVVQ